MNGAVVPGFEDHCWKDIVPAETLKVYEAYHREVFVSSPMTLLAVDLFAGVFPEGPVPVLEAIETSPRSCGVHAWEAMDPIEELIDLFRGSGGDVIFSTQDTSAATTATNRRTAPRAGDFDVHERFAPRLDETVIRKGRASVFHGTPLLDELRRRGTETLVLCGETTSGCVRATAVDAYSHGFHVVLVEDAVFDRNPLSHKVALFDLHHKYADVMALSEFRSHVEGKEDER